MPGISARFVLVDVFTDVAFAGNRLAVFTDARALTSGQMATLAREVGFSECAFVLPPQGEGQVRLRIFTPETELPFAGHPVLGAAFVLGAPLQAVDLHIETAGGLVPVGLEREGARIVFGTMVQPVPVVDAFPHADTLLAALGVERAVLPVERYVNGPAHVMVALASDDEVTALAPDADALAAVLGDAGVSCFHADGARVHTRMFAPGMGVAEDPATGSAAGPVVAHLARHGAVAYGERVTIAQGAELGRRSTLLAAVDGSGDTVTRVEVGGSAVVVGRGEFVL